LAISWNDNRFYGMARSVQIDEFLSLSSRFPIIDVRSPSEFAQGHIPGAQNIPLFSDLERKEVGTTYKQGNRESAMYMGLDFVGKKIVDLAKEGERKAGRGKTLLLHCWRGGMRSSSMAWLFETMGITCHLLEGGYKSYRRRVREEFEKDRELIVLGGRTGSGKTDILQHLEKHGEQVVDLEGLAHHKGSAFGALGEEPQPTTEQFENDLCHHLLQLDPGKRTWIEDESRNVGRCVVPVELFMRMKQSRMLFLDLSMELRASHLVHHYAGFEKEELKACITRISKKLGGDRTQEAIGAVEQNDFYTTAMITLHYYDKAYMFSLGKNHLTYEEVVSGEIDPEDNAQLLLRYLDGKKG
jgi:tRNA 2-selenouridine synthase